MKTNNAPALLIAALMMAAAWLFNLTNGFDLPDALWLLGGGVMLVAAYRASRNDTRRL